MGYLTINPYRGDGLFRQEYLDSLPAHYEGKYLRWVHFDQELEVAIDGRANKGVILEQN